MVSYGLFEYGFVRVEIFVLQTLVAFYLCFKGQSRKDNFERKLTLILGAIFIGSLVAAYIGSIGEEESFFRRFNSSALILSTGFAYLVGFISARLLFNLSLWGAFFCCTAACTIQALASSVENLVWRFFVAIGFSLPGNWFIISTAVVATIIAYATAYFIFLRRTERIELATFNNTGTLAIFVTMLLFILLFDTSVKFFESNQADKLEASVNLLRAIHVALCVFMLVIEHELAINQRLLHEATVMSRIMSDQTKQYEASQRNIEAINIKCHDMRHQIRELAQEGGVVDHEVLDDMEEEIDIYDSSVRTNNDALDTILTEKSLLCKRENITLSCIVDGSALNFMSAAEIYSLFGNALDNAIDAVMEITDSAKRSISLNIHQHLGLISIAVENYCENEPVFREGLPVSTRGDGHGFGMKSIAIIAQRYNGDVSASISHHVFRLNIVLSHPEV